MPQSQTSHGVMGMPAAREQVLAFLERDPLWSRIPNEDRLGLAESALTCGVELCERVVRRFGIRDAETLARELGVRVSREDVAPALLDMAALSAYRHQPPEIVLHGDVIEACAAELIRAGRPDAARRLPHICVAHELYHHLAGVGDIVSPKYRVTVFAAGGMKIRKSLAALNEAAAHVFAACFLELDFLPCGIEEYALAGLRPGDMPRAATA